MFKSLYKETEGFRLVSILTPLCMIGEVVMEMIIPKLMSSIIDDGVTAGAQHGGDGDDHIDYGKNDIEGRKCIASQKT